MLKSWHQHTTAHANLPVPRVAQLILREALPLDELALRHAAVRHLGLHHADGVVLEIVVNLLVSGDHTTWHTFTKRTRKCSSGDSWIVCLKKASKHNTCT